MPKVVHLTAGGVVPDVSKEELATRWPPAETRALAAMRERLRPDLAGLPANAVTSDRRLMRFIKRFGTENVGVDLATESYRGFLAWRRDNGVDAMHDRIISERLDPSTVPYGKRVMELLPQVPCHFEYIDRLGNPISIEYYGFHPDNAMKFKTEEYQEWFIYCSEYKMLFLDHFSTMAELAEIKQARASGRKLEAGWGLRCLRRFCVIRDLKGFQLTHSLSPRIGFVKELLKMSQANYPHLTDHCFFVNTPWMFTIVWSLIKTALSAHTQTKIHILNSAYHEPLSAYVSPGNLPEDLRPDDATALRLQLSFARPLADDEGGGVASYNAAVCFAGDRGPGDLPAAVSSEVVPAPSGSRGGSGGSGDSGGSGGGRGSRGSSAGGSSGSSAAETLQPSPKGLPSESSSSSRGRASGFLTFMKARPRDKQQQTVGECGSVVIAVCDLEMPKRAGGAPATAECRVTIRTLAPVGQPEAAAGAAEDSQPLALPVASKQLFVLSLGPGAIVDNTLRLGFLLDFALEVGGSAKGPTLAATLEVLIDVRSSVEGLLCWVSFYDEAGGKTLANLKALLSYRPARSAAGIAASSASSSASSPSSSASSSVSAGEGKKVTRLGSLMSRSRGKGKEADGRPAVQPMQLSAGRQQLTAVDDDDDDEEEGGAGSPLGEGLATAADSLAGLHAGGGGGGGVGGSAGGAQSPQSPSAGWSGNAGPSSPSLGSSSFGFDSGVSFGMDADYVKGVFATFFQGVDGVFDDEPSPSPSGGGNSPGPSPRINTDSKSGKFDATAADDERARERLTRGPSVAPARVAVASGVAVAFGDQSLDWCVWYQDIDFEVHKCGFEDEPSARAAFGAWSFVRILTRRHVEVGCHGVFLAPVVGAIRETIDLSRPLPTTKAAGGGSGGSAVSSRLVVSAAAGAAATAASPLVAGSSDGEVRLFSVHSSSDDATSGAALGPGDASEWAVWTSTWFETRRYHFDSEASARAALEEWHSVRILSRGEREVAARVRWESMQLSNIRERMEAHRVRLELP